MFLFSYCSKLGSNRCPLSAKIVVRMVNISDK